MNYKKPAINITTQIQLLEKRGLIIDDRPMSEHFLAYVSYYRLAGYWYPLQADKIKHTFKPGSRFQTMIDLYNFDRPNIDIQAMAFPQNWNNEILWHS